MQNIAIIIPDKEGLDSEEGSHSNFSSLIMLLSNLDLGWNLEADLEILMNEIREFHPSLQTACRYAKLCIKSNPTYP